MIFIVYVSADYRGLTIEHIINAGKDMEKLLLLITNEIFKQERVPETLKAGLLTSIFKNKGLKTQATNYRGIAVLPVISKIEFFHIFSSIDDVFYR
jgi:hypothetical protein